MMKGRPRIPSSERRDNPVAARFTLKEHERIATAARHAGASSLSDWARNILLKAAVSVERARTHEGAKFMPLDQRRPAVVEPVQLNGHSAPVIKMPVPSRPEGKKPGWWDQLVQDAMKCPGHRMPV